MRKLFENDDLKVSFSGGCIIFQNKIRRSKVCVSVDERGIVVSALEKEKLSIDGNACTFDAVIPEQKKGG